MAEPTPRPRIDAAALSFELDVERGVFHLSARESGKPIASNLECAIQIGDRILSSSGSRAIWRPLPESDGEGLQIQFGTETVVHLGLRVQCHSPTGGLTFSLSASSTAAPLPIEEALVITTGKSGTVDFCRNFRDVVFFKNGWLSGDPVGAVRAGDPHTDPTALSSSLVSGISHVSTGDGLVMGSLGASHLFTRIEVQNNEGKTSLSAIAEGCGLPIPPGELFTSETLWISYGPNPSLLFRSYADSVPPGRPRQASPVIWDSWRIGCEQTTERQILDALDAIGSRMPGVDTVIIGDGYQTHHIDGPGIGDWAETNPHFHRGLGWLVDQIRKRGYRPGIWCAPFLVGEKSQFVKYYPDAILRSRDRERPQWRESWRGDRAYYLDMTHPDALHFVGEIYENFCYRFGFEVFDVDFSYAAAAEGFHHDAKAAPAAALDRGLQVIRKTIGPDRYLILSGAPQGSGAGLADAVRCTPDSGPRWKGTCGGLAVAANLLGRCFLGGNFPVTIAAPIALDGPDGGTSEEDVRLLATAAAFAGSPIGISGAPSLLSPAQANILQQALPPSTRSAIPIDAFSRSIPQVIGLPVDRPYENWWAVGVFNTTDAAVDRRVDFSSLGLGPGAYHVYEYWANEYLGCLEGVVELERMPPHTCRVLAIHPDLGRPQFLSADDHLLQGAMSVPRTIWIPGIKGQLGTLALELTRPGRSTMNVHIAFPGSMLARSARSRNGRVRIDRSKSVDRVISVEATFRDQCSLEIQFQ